ncbi:ectoine/hydroxyectoine ABC transporter permease subunit EhuC [Pseudomonas sp. ANT_J12]|uniref:ectoine/hydroxyectoine ABC transporter permease subunit EhuC n=1 Tax=Pseudomonas sp. ANT_J12 TaxID=2597351 RepID=UPI0011F0E61B|nr:ectoine/hydroxyectoine ABC transporter permease subunit EhuC [Pseudomonas sp. ANT_J12]KAA0981546.1 ectoine/hydroxyectoine ABC transporter permease subunit EhuC [Pseudomonas sp. ANT_J12]
MLILFPLLMQGVLVTIKIAFYSSVLAIIMAIIAAVGRLSSYGLVRWTCIAYIELFRGTSLVVQLFWLFFVLPMPPFNVELSPMVVAVIGLGLHIGAYGAEVLRGAINSVPRGQIEACIALNVGPVRRFFRVILPQSFLIALPPGTNLLIELIKYTSLVSLVTLSDLTFRARQLDQMTFETLKIFGLAMVMYFILAQVINFLSRLFERLLSRGKLGRLQ